MSNVQENQKICPEDTLSIILRADMIPDRAEVTKVTGGVVYILRHELTVYPSIPAEKPLIVSGLFLVGSRGDINQVNSEKQLCWRIPAEEFVDILRQSWEGDAQ